MKHNFHIDYEMLKLVPLSFDQLEPLRHLRNENRNYFINNEEISSEMQIKWYMKYLDKPNDYMFSIIDSSGVFKGAIALYNVNVDDLTAEFGRIIVSSGSPKYTGTNAIKAIVSFSKDELKLKRIYCSVKANNIRAISIYEKIGFVLLESNEDILKYCLDI